MINIKTSEEIEIMKKSGKILHLVLEKLYESTKEGIKLIELDKLAEELIAQNGGRPSFKTVENYKWTICACVNDVVVHGIPTEYTIKKGDVVGIDCGVLYQGFHTDSAWTKYIDGQDKEIIKFLSTGEQTLKKAIQQVKIGNFIFDISKCIQESVEKGGYSVVRNLVGHGVGKNLHEVPEVPGVVKKPREQTPQIVEGMVLAVEIIYNMGRSEVTYKGNDGWTIATKDGKISGLFEATVAATNHGCIVLT